MTTLENTNLKPRPVFEYLWNFVRFFFFKSLGDELHRNGLHRESKAIHTPQTHTKCPKINWPNLLKISYVKLYTYIFNHVWTSIKNFCDDYNGMWCINAITIGSAPPAWGRKGVPLPVFYLSWIFDNFTEERNISLWQAFFFL